MTFFDILYSVFIQPLQLIFEIIYSIAYKSIGHPGWAIIALSLAMNFLVLPLYKRADAMQEEARDIDAKLHDGVAHIKKTFSGDERMMILQAYYQQNNYKPTDALKGSVSLLLEIPFFMAAYQFLSNLGTVKGVGFGPIADLGAPDALIQIGGFTVNVLPILMTLINVISSAIYLKGFPLKTKIQLYAMAAFFLVFLYTSPSALVFYWTLNNLFSLVKTIFYKLKNPAKVLKVLGLAVGGVSFACGILLCFVKTAVRAEFLLIIGALLLVPISVACVLKALNIRIKAKETENDSKIFFLGSLFLCVLVGALIPSAVIAASPQEFVDITYFYNPIWFIVSSLCLSVGLFLVWLRVFYGLAPKNVKVIFDRAVWVLCGVAVLDYMAFATDMGILTSSLQYESGFSFTLAEQLVNLAAVCALAVVMWLVIKYFKKICAGVLLTAVIALGGMSFINVNQINAQVALLEDMVAETVEAKPQFSLSRDGKNVVVLMLDRAMGSYVPYLFEQSPELKEQFDGFTYYRNTISHGAFTNFGTPGLFGGYEYTPVNMNKRDDLLIVQKHNEALKVMPVIFDTNGYEVTVCDPPYANYSWVPDLSIYSDYPDINAYVTEGKFDDVASKQQIIDNNKRNFFCFGLMKVVPVATQRFIYNQGKYNQVEQQELGAYSTQEVNGVDTAIGLSGVFMKPYNVLENLSNMTNIDKGSTNTFLMFTNNATHEPMLLQMPEYKPSYIVNNTKYNQEVFDRTPTIDGKTLKIEEYEQYVHYQINMAALSRVGEWFDYLREQGVYDNTRIIVVSDHGRALWQIDDLLLDGGKDGPIDREAYFPLLLVKDFGEHGFKVSDEFMTNADVPTLATNGVIQSPVNPFTGKPINSSQKTEREQFMLISNEWSTGTNNGYQFKPGKWLSVKDNLWDASQWKYYPKTEVLPKPVQ